MKLGDFSWLTLITSLLGGGATAWLVVKGLSGHLADRWLTKYKADLDKDMASYKDTLERRRQSIDAELGHNVYVGRTQFDTEYNALKDCFAALGKLKLAFNAVRPIVDWAPSEETFENRIQCMRERYNLFVDTAESVYPFIPEEMHEQFNICSKAAFLEIKNIEADFSKALSTSGYLEAFKHQEAFSGAYFKAAWIVRERFKRVTIVSD